MLDDNDNQIVSDAAEGTPPAKDAEQGLPPEGAGSVDFDALPDDLLDTIQGELPEGTASPAESNSEGEGPVNFETLPDDLLADIQGELPANVSSNSSPDANDGTRSQVNFDALPDDLLDNIKAELSGGVDSLSTTTPQDEDVDVRPKKVVLDSDIDALLFGEEPDGTGSQVDTSDLDSFLNGGSTTGLSPSARRGMDAILKKTMIYYERLPMLEVVFDLLIRLLSTNLRNFTSDNVEIRMDSTKSMRFGDYLNSIPLPAMLGVFKAKEWDNQGLIVVDSTLIYSIVDVLLGGRNANSETLSGDGRTYTTIECNLIEKLIGVVLADLGAAFEPICSVEFVFERLVLNPTFAMIARASNAGILVKLGVEIDDHYGKISLFLPYATIEPIRELLLQNFMGEKFGRDSIWEEHLIAELKETEITFEVHLLTEMTRLSNVLNWKVGDSVYFSSTPKTLVTAKSGEHSLFQGVVGHKHGRVAVKIKDNLLERGVRASAEGESA
jgi:flagellar motor switch protein FliM